VDPVIPTATAAIRAMRMRCLLDVILEIGFLITVPLIISLLWKTTTSSARSSELLVRHLTYRSRTRV